MNDRFSLRESLRLYAVTPCDCRLDDIRAVLEGGATFLQLREKALGPADMAAKARAVRALCPPGVPFVVNDDIDAAVSSGADGVHIGQSDGSVAEARRRIGHGRILGVSASTVREAVEAERDGADYLGVGAVFPTSTKDDAADVSGDALHAICASVRIPVVAIGGITEANLPSLAGSGICGAAVVSALFGAADPREAARRLDAATRAMAAVPVETRRGALVDLDGTVLDSMHVWGDVDRAYLAAHGIPASNPLLARLGSFVHLREAAEFFHGECGIGDSPEAICEEFRQMLADRYLHSLGLVPGAKEALERLRAEGVRTALVTATDEELARPALRRNGVEHLFNLCCFDVAKRTPAALYGVLDRLGTGVSETVVYDDIPSILDLARSAGFAAEATLPAPDAHLP